MAYISSIFLKRYSGSLCFRPLGSEIEVAKEVQVTAEKLDKLDKVLAQWAEVKPELDCSPMGVIGRISRASRLMEKQLESVFKQHGISSIEFDILASLRRSDESLTPTQLYQTLLLSSGAMSTRIEGLVQRGFIMRLASAEDRRSCRVQLTDKGIAFFDPILEAHLNNEQRILAGLSKEQTGQLATILQSWLSLQDDA